MPTASLAVVILITLITIAGVWGTYNLNAELKKSYPSEWEQLGSPTLFSKKSIRQEFRLMRFIAFREYRKFRDPSISHFGNLVFCCTSVNFLLCLFCGILSHWPGPAFFG